MLISTAHNPYFFSFVTDEVDLPNTLANGARGAAYFLPT
jgi:hypothetical protein